MPERPVTKNSEGVYQLADPNHVVQLKAPREASSQTRMSTDVVVQTGFVDGFDIGIGHDGALYTAAYTNNIDFGGSSDLIQVFRSLDDGQSWLLYDDFTVDAPMRGIVLDVADGFWTNSSGQAHVNVYILTETATDNKLTVYQNTIPNSGPWVSNELVADGVKEVVVDRAMFGSNTSNRTFLMYTVSSNQVRAMRSTTASNGRIFQDDHEMPAFSGGADLLAVNIDLAYAIAGDCHFSGHGAGSNSLYVNLNDNNFDPMSWELATKLIDGGTSKNSQIITNHRTSGNAEEFVRCTYLKESASIPGTFGIYEFKREAGTWNMSDYAVFVPSATRNFTAIQTSGPRFVGPVVNLASLNENAGVIEVRSKVSIDGDNSYENSILANDNVAFSGNVPKIINSRVDGSAPGIAYTGENSGFGNTLYFDNVQEDFPSGVNGLTETDGFSMAAFPNPVESMAQIEVHVPHATEAQFMVIDQLGRTVQMLPTQQLTNGKNIIQWQNELPNGMYTIRMTNADIQLTHKITVLK